VTLISRAVEQSLASGVMLVFMNIERR